MPKVNKLVDTSSLHALTRKRDQAEYIGWPALAESFQRDLDQLAVKKAIKSDPDTRVLK